MLLGFQVCRWCYRLSSRKIERATYDSAGCLPATLPPTSIPTRYHQVSGASPQDRETVRRRIGVSPAGAVPPDKTIVLDHTKIDANVSRHRAFSSMNTRGKIEAHTQGRGR
jgi:hypothetical protein